MNTDNAAEWMHSSMADFTPESHMLESHVNSNIPWRVALSEFIDNSLDAGAKRIVVEKVSQRVLRIQDDGCGVEDIVSMFRFGSHRKSSSTKLGRYGVGAKDAWLSCSDVMKVTSVRNAIKTVLEVDYRVLARNNWQGKDPSTSDTDQANGTSIELNLRAGKSHPGKDAFEAISWAFSPAIENGLQILIKSKNCVDVIKAAQIPHMEDVVDCDFEIDGKQVHIRIGILPENVTVSRGPFWLIYGHRVIQETQLGIPSGKSGRKLAGVIRLGNGWKLSRNKDGITENLDRLEEAISVRIQRLVEKAASMSESLQLEALRLKVELELNAAFSNVKEKRPGKLGSKGPEAQNASGKKRQSAAHADENEVGSVISHKQGKGSKRSSSTLRFDFYTSDDDRLGKVDGFTNCVYLNLANPFVQSVSLDDNLQAIVIAVGSLYADYVCNHLANGQKVLKFEIKDFASAAGGLIGSWKGDSNGKRAATAV